MPLRICPFFISAHWLAHISLDSSIISNREHMGVATTFLPNYENWVVPFTCYGWISSVVWFQSASCSKSSFWVVPFIFFMVHSVVWLQRVFHLKSSGWFPFYGSQCCLTQKCSLLKKSSFWVVPFTFYSFQCCLAPNCFLLKNEHST